MDDKKVTIRISEELFKQFRIALITRGETAQAVLEKAVKDYINPKEGNEMKKTNWTDVINAHREAIVECILDAKREGATNKNTCAYAITPEGKIYSWQYRGNECVPEAVYKGEDLYIWAQDPYDPTDLPSWFDYNPAPQYGEEGYDEAVEATIQAEIDAMDMDEIIDDLLKSVSNRF